MDVCVDLNIILVLALLASLVIAGVIIYPSLFGKKKGVDGKVKVGFLSLWFSRIKALLTGRAKIEFDIDWEGDSKIDD